ncbi:hypothetical protein N7493_000785 [Penicillium malachiteum]|uniref:Reverse transcriptase domain-containing protein n=1 Tax=Penicillium malachiteum TaxID=1324776 RepID=A0AAD6HXP5_9EURO|nr:hypothetical protein N7493_000785 [Penicillium malachiteum]
MLQEEYHVAYHATRNHKEGPRGLWKVGKWARSRGDIFSMIPVLKINSQLAESNEAKVNVLHDVFFPTLPEADLSDIALGPDAIPNRVWKLLLSGYSEFGDLLISIFDAYVYVSYNPRYFQESIIVTLRKGGPYDYHVPKSYRPIALMNTLGKLLEAVVAARISYAVEEHSLLPKTHLGSRKGISVDHAIQLILSEG